MLVSGFQKIYFGLGLILGCLGIYGIVSNPINVIEVVYLIGIPLALLILGRPGKFKLSDTELTVRSCGFLYQTYPLVDLSWVYLTDDGGAYIYFGKDRLDLGADVPGHKKFRTEFEKIGRSRLSYFGYMTVDRDSTKRGQLSGCLECHSIFSLQEIESWTKVSNSRWPGAKGDLFYPKCPFCEQPWVFTNKINGTSATLKGIQDLDTYLLKDAQGERKFIPFGLF